MLAQALTTFRILSDTRENSSELAELVNRNSQIANFRYSKFLRRIVLHPTPYHPPIPSLVSAPTIFRFSAHSGRIHFPILLPWTDIHSGRVCFVPYAGSLLPGIPSAGDSFIREPACWRSSSPRNSVSGCGSNPVVSPVLAGLFEPENRIPNPPRHRIVRPLILALCKNLVPLPRSPRKIHFSGVLIFLSKNRSFDHLLSPLFQCPSPAQIHSSFSWST